MDIKPQSQQPISDDQELAKVLAGVSAEADDAKAQADETKTELPTPDVAATPPMSPPPAATVPPVDEVPTSTPTMPMIGGDSSLDGVKQEAISELRPLVDKLNVSPEEKFDTYLLLLRSTDDKSLVAPAHETAKQISDETRRAQALLDIIKEIDFLSQPQQ